MGNNVRLQNLRDFTVQIRHTTTDKIVGTGIVVSVDGKIATCTHVVEAAGIDPRNEGNAEVGVYFPQVSSSAQRARRATVAMCLPESDDDVVLLQLFDGPSLLGPEQIAVLGAAESSQGNEFRSYGYRRLDDYIAGWADGRIQGAIEPQQGLNVQCDLVQLESNQINRGMSGAAVLDIQRNLIVGIVSQTWYPDRSGKDQSTAWAVNARVLSFHPFGLPVQEEPYPLRSAPRPKIDASSVGEAAVPDPGMVLHNAPAPLAEWVGRKDLLQAIINDWSDPNRRITGLIGFGGEGKSSLTRRWLDELLADKSHAQPNGVFWWGFYEKPNLDEFFKAALAVMTRGRIHPRDYPSARAKAQLIGTLLSTHRYLFILDGLEVMQHQEGDQYGLIKNDDLREFLHYFASPGQESFCLITSRAPLIDLIDFTTYTDRDVDRLSIADGRALLRALGVNGSDQALDVLVAAWDGHALTLSLLGTFLATKYAGDVAHISEIPFPSPDEPRYERVRRVLRRYDEHLTSAERAFLMLFGAFQTHVEESAFTDVFRVDMGADALNASIVALNESEFETLIGRLLAYRILRHNPQTRRYTIHPLVRDHYSSQFTTSHPTEVQQVHRRIKDYYLSLVRDMPLGFTLHDLSSLSLAMYHACLSKDSDSALSIYKDRLVVGLTHQLGAYETVLELVRELFPNGDTSQDPQVSGPSAKSFILNSYGLQLTNKGRLSQAPPFFERSIAITTSIGEWHNASVDYQNLSRLYAYSGALEASTGAAREAYELARRARDNEDKCIALVLQAWVAYLRGIRSKAGELFLRAEELERKLYPNRRYLFGTRGIHHADHLRRNGDIAYARRIVEENREHSETEFFARVLRLWPKIT